MRHQKGRTAGAPVRTRLGAVQGFGAGLVPRRPLVLHFGAQAAATQRRAATFASLGPRRTIESSGSPPAARTEEHTNMPNPALNENAWKKAVADDQVGWAAPAAGTADTGTADPGTYHAPIDDGPISPYRTGRMTMGGAMSATGVLFVVLLAFGAIGWSAVTTSPVGEVEWPSWIFLPMFGALGVAFLTIFKPHLARFTEPRVRARSRASCSGRSRAIYDAQWNGIVIQAVAPDRSGVLRDAASCTRPASSRSPTACAGWRSSRPFGVVVVLRGRADRCRLFGREHAVHHGSRPLRHRVQRRRSSAWPPSTSMLDFDFIERGAQRGPAEADGVVRGVRPDGHPRVAVPRDAAAARQAAFPLIGSATVGRHG